MIQCIISTQCYQHDEIIVSVFSGNRLLRFEKLVYFFLLLYNKQFLEFVVQEAGTSGVTYAFQFDISFSSTEDSVHWQSCHNDRIKTKIIASKNISIRIGGGGNNNKNNWRDLTCEMFEIRACEQRAFIVNLKIRFRYVVREFKISICRGF